ncbi:hypothetical protein PPACK8108_LOCUS25413 [Phakopsora pachyrhizi]|uniref:Uncharacterized protein n=1 Tax=Phakopsora pachyrhizi TaxID=170000 RepID=A0AAV0BRU9_PHAPC|nr:hypothetical protein PPACK8108_LOCUS25413 [Phakopsora pachyrhizi]
MEEKPEIKIESKIDWQIKQGSGLGFAGLGPRQVAVRGGSAGRAGQLGLGLDLLGWVLGRWQVGLAGRQAWLGRWGSQGRAVWLTGAAGAWLGFAGLSPRQAGRVGQLVFAGLGPRQVGAARAWLGFSGLGPSQVAARAGQVGQVGHVGRLAGFVGAGRSSRPGQSGQGMSAGWPAWLGRWGRLGQSGQAGAAGARLGFAGLGSRQVAVRAGQVGHARAARACIGFAVAWSGWAGWAGGAGRIVALRERNRLIRWMSFGGDRSLGIPTKGMGMADGGREKERDGYDGGDTAAADNRTEEQRIQDKQDRGAENSVVRIKNNKREALV